jgi:hypothetical protein
MRSLLSIDDELLQQGAGYLLLQYRLCCVTSSYGVVCVCWAAGLTSNRTIHKSFSISTVNLHCSVTKLVQLSDSKVTLVSVRCPSLKRETKQKTIHTQHTLPSCR